MLPVCREIMSEHNEILGMPGISLTFLAGGQLVSAECTIGMVRGLTPLKHYGAVALWNYGNKV